MSNTQTVSIKLLMADPNQPRQEFFKDEMKTLKDSIKDKGIMNPIVVEPLEQGKYLIIDGERRFRAAQELGLTTVPVNIYSKKMSPSERNVMRFQLQENSKEWSVLEKAQAIKGLKEDLNITSDQLAQALSMTGATVRNYIRLLSFAPDRKKQLVKARLPFTYLHNLSRIMKLVAPEIKEAEPDILDKCIKKYENGFIRDAKDYALIARLASDSKHKTQVVKFLNNDNYSASDAFYASGYVSGNVISTIIKSARALNRNIKSMGAKNMTMSQKKLDILYALKNTLDERLDNIKVD